MPRTGSREEDSGGEMSEYTATYEDVLKRWSALCGIQYSDLLTTETDLFTEFANFRLRYIWNYTNWPETIGVSEEVLVDRQFTADDQVMHVLGVYDSHPDEIHDAKVGRYRFKRTGDTVTVYGGDVADTVWTVYKKRYPAFGSATDTIPMRFMEFVASGAYADWLRTEQDPMADRQDQKTMRLLEQQLDIFERLEQQSEWHHGYKLYQPSTYY